jgi:hypothetical protein
VFVFPFSIAFCSYSLQGIWLFSIISLKPVQYDGQDYPRWAIVVGWMLGMVSLLPIPLMIAIVIYYLLLLYYSLKKNVFFTLIVFISLYSVIILDTASFV